MSKKHSMEIDTKYLSAEKAKEKTLESLKEKAAKDYETQCVLEKIHEAVKDGLFEITIYDDDKVRDNLNLLGYSCSEPIEDFGYYNDLYMKVSWL